MTTEHALQLTGLSCGYDGVSVVSGCTLTVAAGEVVALLGANGAGKTTTMSTVAGLLAPLAGSVALFGQDVTRLPPHRRARRGLALVPEGRALFPTLTVREHLRLARARRGMAEAEVLDMLPELSRCLHRRAGLMSGGEQQMLALGRALVSRPRVLLVDELSLGLAPVIVQRLLPVLRRAATELGTAVLFVEQHVTLALQIADRACVLDRGRITLSGTAAELAARRDLVAASYLGASATDPDGPSPSGHP